MGGCQIRDREGNAGHYKRERSDEELRKTTVNSDLRILSWNNPPRQHPHYLRLKDMRRMIRSNAPFARKFRRDAVVLDKIDSQLLSRGNDMIVRGSWCIGSGENGIDACLVTGNTTVLRPTRNAKRLELS